MSTRPDLCQSVECQVRDKCTSCSVDYCRATCPRCGSTEIESFEEGWSFYQRNPTAQITDLHCTSCHACWNRGTP